MILKIIRTSDQVSLIRKKKSVSNVTLVVLEARECCRITDFD